MFDGRERYPGAIGSFWPLDVRYRPFQESERHTYGHLAGDIVLKMVAGTISGALRPLDTAVPFGGEEFAVLVPNCNEEYLFLQGSSF
ncbi:MAG: diguanylate cyclase domain-containing protein [Rectinema subterraneum]